MLWFCLHFPLLPLELFSRAAESDCPWAVSRVQGGRQTLWLCNEAAAALGLRAGMTPGGAYGLAPSLQLRQRDETAEQQALAGLAAWAGQFSSLVSLLPPQALLLEIAGSLRLFGGLDALLGRIRSQAGQLGYGSALGVAPTPLAAWLLARVGRDRPVMEVAELPAALRDLPLALLDLDERLSQTLRRLGLRTLGDLLRLPRADLGRRLGNELILYLDRLLGRHPDPRPAYEPPARFHQTLLLPAETRNAQALLFPARRLLLELAGFLTARQAGAQRLHWQLTHHRQPATCLDLGLAAPSRDAEHLLRLLGERLEHTSLPQAVEALSLAVDDCLALQGHNLSLDGGSDSAASHWPQLVERLRARLGEAAVQGLSCHADHRPERAWRPAPPGTEASTGSHPARPLWLLPEPVVLKLRDGRPCLDGQRLSLQGPERLESGWWDGNDISRDYFIARDAGHGRYWIFRERRTRAWYLHGLFA